MPKVYIVHKKDFDMSGTRLFGEQVVMFDGLIDDVFNLPRLAALCRAHLKTFSKEDYLCLSGNLVVNAVAVAIATTNLECVNVLLYDVRQAQYVPRSIAKNHLYIV